MDLIEPGSQFIWYSFNDNSVWCLGLFWGLLTEMGMDSEIRYPHGGWQSKYFGNLINAELEWIPILSNIVVRL